MDKIYLIFLMHKIFFIISDFGGFRVIYPISILPCSVFVGQLSEMNCVYERCVYAFFITCIKFEFEMLNVVL